MPIFLINLLGKFEWSMNRAATLQCCGFTSQAITAHAHAVCVLVLVLLCACAFAFCAHMLMCGSVVVACYLMRNLQSLIQPAHWCQPKLN